MSRPEAWRRDAGAYPFTAEVQTRWADLDMLGHINNVSMAGLFEEGRGRFTSSLQMVRASRDVRWLIAGVSINYLAEGHHPQPVTIASGIGHIGTRSWTVFSAAFQNGVCVATCDTATVYTDKTGAVALPEEYVAKLAEFRIAVPE
ncbi:thioesterase family protein [Sphingomonas sp. SUN039]|uniref:acyl-CoA thioesterase n=1 Tax=Sphingomonas sp. SUN039 TaxID=2937787 RepID=UPI0021649B6D|nr:acyl-CoA thioesterase [Sphingomonas sp. SUN039]UVO54543.1 acyl-CoA thioesterase [Sphingomonas sp. SUN039]